MSGPISVPQEEPAPPSGKGDGPASRSQSASSPAASTTDLGRFPEKLNSDEVSSLFAGEEVGGVRTPDEPKVSTVRVPPDDEPANVEPGLDFDPQIEIERRISAGGMGEVFLGIQKHLGRKVAVKRIRDWGADAATKERFIHEARAQSRFQHPGIAQVYDLREAHGEFYLIMEYVEGRTLEEILAKDGKFTPDRVASVGVQLTEALEAAAHEGYIHRDLKPGNVMLMDGGKVKIIDFGLALLVRNLKQTRFTEKGEVLGTPAFMSPEQLNQEENLDIRSDIWSLGVLLYTLATAETPFTGKDFVCTVKNVMMAEPVPLPTLETAFPPGLWQAIAHALRKDRAERWQDYASFREALLQSKDASSAAQEAPSCVSAPGDASPHRARRRPLGWGLAAAALIATVFLVQALRGPKEGGTKMAQKPPSTDIESARRLSLESDPSGRPPAVSAPIPEPPIPAPSTLDAKAAKREEPGTQKSAPPRLRLRDRLLASPPSAVATEMTQDLLLRFERHAGELASFYYINLTAELTSLEGGEATNASSAPTAQDRELFATYLHGAQKLVLLAQGALNARLEELRASKGPVTLQFRAGGTVTGTIESITPTAITQKGEGGVSFTTPLERLSPEEFRPKAAPEAAELAFQALSISPARTLPALLDLEASDEEVFLWLPAVVRLARLEVEAKARQAATDAKPLLLESRAPENSTATLVSWTAAKAAEDVLGKSEKRMPAAYGMLSPEFAKARQELDALELLFHRQFSRAAALHPTTSGGVVAGALQLELFEKDLAAASDELLEGSGWFNWRWELRPTHPDVKERRKYLVPKPDEELVVLQDEEGPRSLVMNDITSRAPEGVFLRVRLDPLGNQPESAEWRFHLLSGKGGPSYLRVAGGQVEVYRSTLAPGATDVRLAQASLPLLPVEQRFRTYALVPGAEYLHIYVDRHLVLSIPREDGTVPKQLALVVLHGKLSVRNLQAKRAPAADGASRK